MIRSPPLRFLVLVVGGWAGARAVLLIPWSAGAGLAAPAAVHARAERAAARETESPPSRAKPDGAGMAIELSLAAGRAAVRRRERAGPTSEQPSSTALGANGPFALPGGPRRPSAAQVPPVPVPAVPLKYPSRWSFSAWSFVRRGAAGGLAPGGTLGGSQAGGRIAFRVAGGARRPLALVLRGYAPLERPVAAEAALGLDWKPMAAIPLHLAAERRQRLGREGRSAFGLAAYGGVSDVGLGGFRLDAYAQAGIVGTRSRDLFADGAARLSLAVGPRLKLGAGLWAAAQPGAERLDLGPQASLRLPVGGTSVTFLADWRLRVAGSARPGSGPALTMAAEF